MKIESKDISVVVQGAINRKYIKKTLRSIRKYLPKAEIILSTWKGTDISGLDYDILILNEDPGAEIFTIKGKKHNLNRQVLSTKNGVKNATRKYVLKIRSDMRLMGTKFLSFFGKYPIRDPNFAILSERVLINSLYTRSANKQPRYLFHPSDWMMFGLRQDMLNIWDIPLAPEPDTSHYFCTKTDMGDTWTRYHAEQYYWLAFLQKNNAQIEYENCRVWTKKLQEISDSYLVNNTILLEYKKQFDILCMKYPARFGDSETMHPIDWLKLYKQYCDKNFISKELYTEDEIFCLTHLFSHIYYFCYKNIVDWLNHIFCIPYYLIKLIFVTIRNKIAYLKAQRKS